MITNIFVDLDETLIHSIPAYGGKGMGKRKRIQLGPGETYHTCKRHSTPQIVDALKEIAPTKIFTMGTRDYALAINETLELGFSPNDIIAREDYSYETNSAYGRETVLKDLKIDPQAILIDNLEANNQNTSGKMRYLGITPDRFFHIRTYTGGKDPEKFTESEWPTILEAIKKLIS